MPPDLMASMGGAGASDGGAADEKARPPKTGAPGGGLPPGKGHSGAASQGLRQQLRSLGPKALTSSITSQLLGEKSSEQQQHEQKEAAKQEQRVAQSQQDFQTYQAQQRAAEEKRVAETIELKSQAVKLGSHLYQESSAVLSQTTQGDETEKRLVEIAMKNAQEAKQREAKARQMMLSMIAHMQSGGNESGQNTLSDDQDARQRQREQAMGE